MRTAADTNYLKKSEQELQDAIAEYEKRSNSDGVMPYESDTKTQSAKEWAEREETVWIDPRRIPAAGQSRK